MPSIGSYASTSVCLSVTGPKLKKSPGNNSLEKIHNLGTWIKQKVFKKFMYNMPPTVGLTSTPSCFILIALSYIIHVLTIAKLTKMSENLFKEKRKKNLMYYFFECSELHLNVESVCHVDFK